jgi:hypothetical protein
MKSSPAFLDNLMLGRTTFRVSILRARKTLIHAVFLLMVENVSAQPAFSARESHGEQQVRRLLEDRIHMSAYPTSDGRIQTVSWEDSIVKWAVAQFEQKTPGHLLFWNSDPPQSPPSFLADHNTPQSGKLSFICVAKEYSAGPAKGQYIQFEVLWFLTAFELLNSAEREAWMALDQRAANGEMSKGQYINEAAHIEFNVLRKLIKFYHEIWSPWARSVTFRSDPSIWRLDTPAEFDKWISMYTDHESYPWVPFGELFEYFQKYGVEKDK